MLYLLYGPDTYRSRKKLREIIEEYRKKVGSNLNFHRFDAREQDFSAIRGIGGAPSLFASKKLMVIENLFSSDHDADALHEILEKIRDMPNEVVVLWDGELDQAAQKRLDTCAPFISKIQEFKYLRGSDLDRWIREGAQERGIILSPAELASFSLFGSDLWRIHNELDKAAVQKSFRAVPSDALPTIFNLGDTFFSEPAAALRYLAAFLSGEGDEFSLFSYLASHVRTLLMIQSYISRGLSVPISRGIHPFVIKKALPLARMLSYNQLRGFLRHFFEGDYHAKVGMAKPGESLERMLFRSLADKK